MDDEAHGPEGRFTFNGGPVYEERYEEHLSYKELRPGLVSGLY